MRLILFSAASLTVLLTGCVDAPLQPAHLGADGQLSATHMEQSAISAEQFQVARQVVNVTAVLAAQESGALEDADAFSPDVGAVHLHLRADGLTTTRPVTFVWTHGEERDELAGVLAPSRALTRVSSRSITPEQTGAWTVEVFESATTDSERKLLFTREFQVL